MFQCDSRRYQAKILLVWALLGSLVAYALAQRITLAAHHGAPSLWIWCTVGGFIALLSSIAVLRVVLGRPGRRPKIGGLPLEDWGFAAVFASIAGTAGWIALL